MDKQWQSWIMENLQRNCDPAGIRDILLENKFSLADIRRAMGDKFPAEEAAPETPTPYVGTPENPLRAKSACLLQIQRDLARLNPFARQIERRSNLSGNEFLERYYSANRPVILCGLMSLWQAQQKWTPDYLKATCGNESIEVSETHAGKGKSMRFADYVSQTTAAARSAKHYYLSGPNDFFTRPTVKPLLTDIEIFTEYLAESQGAGISLALEPKGAHTPLQHEEVNMMMAQVQGRKSVKLIPAGEIELVYNHRDRYSQVDIEKPDYEKFPKFRYANITEVELAAGEVLFLPVGWWYASTVLESSISVGFTHFLFPNTFQWKHP